MDKKLYKFGMDWLNGVLPVSDVWEVFKMFEMFSSKLRFDRWELVNSGKYNYSRRYCLDGKATIQLMYNPVSDEEAFTANMEHNNSGVFFSISGDGIRYLHSLGGDVSALNKLLFYFYRNGFRASRFDVYCDILDKDNVAVPVIQEAFLHFIKYDKGDVTLKTKLQRHDKSCRLYPHYDVNGEPYLNCELGGHGSRFGMFRCYNKLDEVRTGRLQNVSEELISSYGAFDYWYRLEYEVHKENAAACFNACMKNAVDDGSPLCFESVFASALERVFSIVVFTTHNLAACKVDSNWQQFCNFVTDNSIDLVQFAPPAYVPMSKARLFRYIRKNSVFVFSMIVALLLNRSLMLEVVKDGSEKYFKKKKYNEVRDELNVPGWMDLFVKSQLNRSINALDKWVA